MANYCTIISKGGFKMSNKIKNQILICSILALGACATFSQNDNNPVSYTHLDVYKRQEIAKADT